MYHLTDHVKVHERKDWHARPPESTTPQRDPHEAFIHHGAESDHDARAVDTQAEVFAAMRGIQNFHMNGNGWSDIGYHYVVFQAHGSLKFPHICEGRMVRHVPAAQLNHNTGTLAVCIYGLIDSGDPLQDATVNAIGALLHGRHADKTGVRAVTTVGGHRDVTQTSCPGDTVYHALDRIAHAAGVRRFHA